MEKFLSKFQDSLKKELMESMKGVSIVAINSYGMEASFETKMGTSVVLLPILPQSVKSNLPGCFVESFVVRIQVIENLNTSNPEMGALVCTHKICHALNHLDFFCDGVLGVIYVDEKHPWREVRDSEKLGRYIVESQFLFQINSGVVPVKKRRSL